VLKIDVQGAELSVLQGASELLNPMSGRSGRSCFRKVYKGRPQRIRLLRILGRVVFVFMIFAMLSSVMIGHFCSATCFS
jgi:hypothetical protein